MESFQLELTTEQAIDLYRILVKTSCPDSLDPLFFALQKVLFSRLTIQEMQELNTSS